MQSNQVHIQCEYLGEGMFPSESAIKIETVEGNCVSALVDKSLLKESDSKTFLRVTLVKSTENVSVCLLPIETNSGSRWVRVSNNSILENCRELQLA